MSAHTRAGFAGDTAIPLLPQMPAGSPGLFVSSIPCADASVDLNIPLPSPPETSVQGRRTACDTRPYSAPEFEESSARSAAAAESFRNRTLVQVFPPSVLLYTPRSGLGADTYPCAATYAMSGFVVRTRARAIFCASA